MTQNPSAFARHSRRPKALQHGAVLGTALIFLLLLSILALTASSGSTLQLRMAGNLRNAEQAQLSANTALRGAEWRLWSNAQKIGRPLICIDGGLSAHGCIQYNASSGAYASTGVVTQFKTSHDWVAGTGIEHLGADGGIDYTADSLETAQLAENPRYIIEDMGLVRALGAGAQIESGSTGPTAGGPGMVNIHAYRITARATGGSANSIRVLQSTFDAQPNN